jgi:hypothetical protein
MFTHLREFPPQTAVWGKHGDGSNARGNLWGPHLAHSGYNWGFSEKWRKIEVSLISAQGMALLPCSFHMLFWEDQKTHDLPWRMVDLILLHRLAGYILCGCTRMLWCWASGDKGWGVNGYAIVDEEWSKAQERQVKSMWKATPICTPMYTLNTKDELLRSVMRHEYRQNSITTHFRPIYLTRVLYYRSEYRHSLTNAVFSIEWCRK